MENFAGDVPSITAHVVRVNVVSWRLAQLLVPVATVASVVARRVPNVLTTVLAFSSLVATGTVLFVARRSLGRRQIQLAAGKIMVAGTELVIRRSDVTAWTYDQNTARLYGIETSWRLVVGQDDADSFRLALTPIFGRPRFLKRRGSRRARAIAFSVAALGGITLAIGISMNIVATVFVGVPCLVFGLATFGAFSQKIAN